MHRYAAGFAAGVIFTLATETVALARTIHHAITSDDSVDEDDTADPILAH